MFERLKTAWKVLTQVATIDLHKQVLELQAQVAEERQARARAEQEVVQLRAQLAKRAEVFHDGGAYWERRGAGKDGPYCTKCWEDEQKLIRLKHANYETFFCPKCGGYSDVPDAPGASHRPPPRQEPPWGGYNEY